MTGPRCERFLGDDLGGKRCPRKATHDLGWAAYVQLRDTDAEPQWRVQGKKPAAGDGDPIMVQGVIRLLSGGSAYCRLHAESWANDLNRDRMEKIMAAEDAAKEPARAS